jgi:nitrous oxidase accessory protein
VKALFQKPDTPWLIAAIVAGFLLLGSLFVPLWRLELVAPQYPEGLIMRAYGYKFAEEPSSRYDDIREINELNHYIGMKPIKEVTEMKLFIPGVLALALGTALLPFVRWQRRWFRLLIVLGFWTMPLFFVADLQYWLYDYGHSLDPKAALTMDPFTPKVIGETKVWNFNSKTAFELGFYFLVAGALAITLIPAAPVLLRRLRAATPSGRRAGRRQHASPIGRGATALKILLPLALLAGAGLPRFDRAAAQDAGSASTLTLQQRIDAAAPEDIVIVDGGAYTERIVIDKPISLVGRNWPVIDGGGQGDVVTISADDVAISGFEVRNSGKSISSEPAAIKVKSADRVQIIGNRIRDSYFAVHMTESVGSSIDSNDFRAGAGVPQERRGHGVYLWRVSESAISKNVIRDAADAIHLEFSESNLVVENDARDSRYALHFMYSPRNKIVRNYFVDNLAGAVLMFSHELIVKDNEFSSNREGATGVGMLLKDDDNIFVEGNRLIRNKFGITIEGSPQSVGATAIFRRNLFALNDVGVALMSNSPITFVENAVIDNGVQVKAISGSLAHAPAGAPAPDGQDAALPKGAVWSSAGRGNYWSDYRGYDEDGDGVGDQPYSPRPAFAGRLADDDTLRLFQFTPAQQAIDLAAQMFPLFRYDAVIEDPYPLLRPPEGLTLAGDSGRNVPLLVLSGLLAALAATVIVGVGGLHAGPRLPIRARGAQPRGGLAA